MICCFIEKSGSVQSSQLSLVFAAQKIHTEVPKCGRRLLVVETAIKLSKTFKGTCQVALVRYLQKEVVNSSEFENILQTFYIFHRLLHLVIVEIVNCNSQLQKCDEAGDGLWCAQRNGKVSSYTCTNSNGG